MHLSSPLYLQHALPISVFLIWSPEWYLVRSTDHKALRYVVFSTPLLSRPSEAQMSSSASYSRKSSAYFPPSMWQNIKMQNYKKKLIMWYKTKLKQHKVKENKNEVELVTCGYRTRRNTENYGSQYPLILPLPITWSWVLTWTVSLQGPARGLRLGHIRTF